MDRMVERFAWVRDHYNTEPRESGTCVCGHHMTDDEYTYAGGSHGRYVCNDCGRDYVVDVNGVMWERTAEAKLVLGRDWLGKDLARAEAAEAEAQRLTEGLREQGEPIMDERFRDRLLRHVLSNEEVSQLVDAIESREARARALLAASPSDEPIDGETWGLMQGGGGAK